MSELQISPITSEQPAPQPGELSVAQLLSSIRSRVSFREATDYDLVAEDVLLRLKMGEEKYGSPLMTHNGRSADLDLYLELCDSVAYLTQKIFETREPELALALIDDVDTVYGIAVRCRKRLVAEGVLSAERE